MTKFNCIQKLLHVVTGLYLVDLLALFEHVCERAVVAKIKHHVHVIRILEKMVIPHDVGVLEPSVDLDLLHQSLLCPSFGQRRLLHTLNGHDLRIGGFLAVALQLNLVAFGESTLAEKVCPPIAFGIFLARNLFSNFD